MYITHAKERRDGCDQKDDSGLLVADTINVVVEHRVLGYVAGQEVEGGGEELHVDLEVTAVAGIATRLELLLRSFGGCLSLLNHVFARNHHVLPAGDLDGLNEVEGLVLLEVHVVLVERGRLLVLDLEVLAEKRLEMLRSNEIHDVVQALLANNVEITVRFITDGRVQSFENETEA